MSYLYRQTEEAGGGGGSSFGFFGFTKRVGQFVEDVATTLDDTIGHAFEEWQLDGSTRLGGGSARGGDECSAAAEDKEGLCATPENMGACRGAPEMSPVSSSECSSSVMEEWGDFSIDNEDEMARLWRRNKVVRRLEQQVRELGRENEELKASRIDEQTRHQIEKLVEEKSELKRENDRLVRENKSLSEMVAYLVATSPASCDSIDHSILLDGMVDHPPPILHHDGSSSSSSSSSSSGTREEGENGVDVVVEREEMPAWSKEARGGSDPNRMASPDIPLQ